MWTTFLIAYAISVVAVLHCMYRAPVIEDTSMVDRDRTLRFHVVVHVKGDERYVWQFEDGQVSEVLRRVGQAAGNPDLSLTWYDAAQIANKIREDGLLT